MLPKQALAWMIDLERRIGDLSVSYGMVDIWPIIRNSVILALLDESGKPWPARKQRLSKGTRFFRSLRSLFQARQTDLLFVTDTKYSECIGGLYYIKDVNGVAAMEEHQGKSLELAFPDEPDRTLSHDVRGAISFYALRIIASALTKALCLRPMPKRLSVIVDTVCDAYSNSGSSNVETPVLRKRLKNNIVFAATAGVLLRIVLKRTKPEKVFIHCYYSPFGMALCAAGKSCGIDVVDVQHGLAGRNMRAYGQWENSPKGGFSTLPSRFFCWTETDAQAVNEWSEAVGLGRIAVYTGQFWLETFLNSGLYELASREWSFFIEDISKYRKVVVVTMQFCSVDKFWKDIVSDAENSLCLLFRGHPNFQVSDTPEEISNFVDSNPNVFFSEPTRMPLPLLLRFADLNVTSRSASAYESVALNTDTVISTKMGRDYFDGVFCESDCRAILDQVALKQKIFS